MPGPYALPTTRVTGGPDPAADMNAANAALNEATPNATANLLMLRDSAGRAKVADPSAATDVANRQWVLTQTGLMVPKSVVDAKGDMLVATANDAVSRLAVGTDGQVLTADSAQVLGVKWATPAAGGSAYGSAFDQIIPQVGDDFTSSYFTTTAAQTLRDQSSAGMPLSLPRQITVDQVSFNVTIAAVTNLVADLALRIWNPATSAWDLVATLATNISVATVAVVAVTFTPQVLVPGELYNFRLFQQGTYDGTLRVTGGKMNGPGIGPSTGYGVPLLPWGANSSTSTGVPILRVRRSA